MKEAGGSPAAGHLSCAAKKGNRKKAAPGVAPRIRGVTLCCLPRWGDCATRPGEAHTTCLPMGLEQSSSTSPHRVELLGAPHGGNGVLELTLPQLTRKLNQTTIILLRRKVRTLTGDEHPAFRAFHPDIEIAQMKGFGLTFAGQVDMD